MRFGVIVFPGSNCDNDVKYVLSEVLNREADFIWHQERDLGGYDCVVLPGGFSYGDYLREGAIAKFSPVMDAVMDFADSGGLVIGICNGFQILLEAGLLPGAMTKNDNLQFRCHDTHLRVENSKTPFSNRFHPNEVLKMPIAHAAGNYYIDSSELKGLEECGQVVFRYCNSKGEVDAEANPNGSKNNIAGICNKNQNVAGIMPHPERCSEEILSGTDGIRFFQSLMEWFNGGFNDER